MVSVRSIMLGLCVLSITACDRADAPANDTAAPNATPAAAPSATASLWNGGASKPLEIQVAHPNGVVLQVTSLQSRPTDTAVGIRVINGRDREIDLNGSPNNRDGFLLLENGERLFLSPPTSNAKLTVPAGQTFEGELVFLGRLPPVRSGVMVLNENSSGDSPYSNNPGFRIDLPLAGSGQ